MTISERQGVEIDFCPKCRGVWLDRDELDKLLEREAALTNEALRPRSTFEHEFCRVLRRLAPCTVSPRRRAAVIHNVGRRDSALRIALGFVLAPTSILITAPIWIQVTLGAIAAFALVTGVVRYCPLFGLVGASSLEPSLPSKKETHRKAA